MPGFNQGGGTVRNINARLLFESVYKATGMRQAVTSGVSASRNAARSAVSTQQAMIRGTDAGILRLKNQMANINVAPNLSGVAAQRRMLSGADAGILRLQNQMANIRVSPNLAGARSNFLNQQGSLIQSTRGAFAQARALEGQIGWKQFSKEGMEARAGNLGAQREALMKEELLRMKTDSHPLFRQLKISGARENKYLALRQAAKYDPSLEPAANAMWNRMRSESQKAGGFLPSRMSRLGEVLGKTEGTEIQGKILSIRKQEEGTLKSVATISQQINNLEKEKAKTLEAAKTGQKALVNTKKEGVNAAKAEAKEEEQSQKSSMKKKLDLLMDWRKKKQEAAKESLKLAKQEALEEEKSQRNILKTRMAGIMAHKKEKQERIKDIQDAARIEQEALRTQSQLTSDIMSKWGGIVNVLQEIGNALLRNLELTKQFREAIILSGTNYSEDAFKQTAFGMDINQMGQIYKAISRSAFPEGFQGKESMLAAFESMFGVEASSVVPMVGGMKSMFGNGVSMDKIMKQMFATSATSSFDFSGWSSIAMQGAIPALEDLGVGIEQASALLAGISNMGGGPFAAGFGLSGLSQLAAPSKKQAGVLAQLGITKPSEFIRANGILNLLQKINDETAKLDASARDNAIKELFPSMTKGTSLMIMNNLDYFRKLEEMYKNPWFQASTAKKVELLPVNQLKEVTALVRNIGAGFIDMIASSYAVKLVFGTIKQLLKGIMGTIIAINKNPMLKQILGVAAAFITILTTVKLIKLMMLDIGKLAGSFKTFGILQPSAWMSVGQQEKLSSFLGKASPLLTTLGGVAAGIGVIAIGVSAIKAMAEARQQKEAIRQADNMQKLYELSKKKATVGLTPEEERIYYQLALGTMRGNKFANNYGESVVKFQIEVTGQTNPDANNELAEKIKEKIMKENEEGFRRGLIRFAGN